MTTNDLPASPTSVTLHVAELDGDGPARPFWKSRGNAEVLARLDQDRLLLASYGEPYALVVVDLRAGTSRVLADGCPHHFVALHGHATIHLRDTAESAVVHGEFVLHLGDPRDRPPLAPDNFFYATPWREHGERRRLADCRADRIAEVAGNLAVLIAEHDAAVWIVSLTHATGREIWRPPAGARALRAVLSPGGQRLAIGCVQASDGMGRLAVVDVATAKSVREWSGLPIQVSPVSSNMPTLEVGWHDDAEVLCSETRGDRHGLAGDFVHVRRRLADGAITDEQVYGPIGLSHRTPPPPGPPTPATVPTFVVEHGADFVHLRRHGAKEPVADLPLVAKVFHDVRLAPDGHAALVLDGRRARCTLFTEKAPAGRVVLSGGGYDARWLPAVR